MAANVLRSPQAVEMSVFVVRAFVRLRRSAAGRAELGLLKDSGGWGCFRETGSEY